MNTREAFLADICRDPEDDAVRLIFADWLEENGEGERGELIRVQCRIAEHRRALAEMSFDNQRPAGMLLFSQRSFLADREYDLIEAHGFDWFAPLTPCLNPDNHVPPEDMPALIRRGFAVEVRCSASDFLLHADALTAVAPLERVRLTDWPKIHVESSNDLRERPTLRFWDYPSPIIPIPRELRTMHEIDQTMTPQLLSIGWPGIEFTLPPPRQYHPDDYPSSITDMGTGIWQGLPPMSNVSIRLEPND